MSLMKKHVLLGTVCKVNSLTNFSVASIEAFKTFQGHDAKSSEIIVLCLTLCVYSSVEGGYPFRLFSFCMQWMAFHIALCSATLPSVKNQARDERGL